MMAGGLVWLAWATYRASPWLAFIGGGPGVIGLFAVMVDNGFNIAGASLADGLELAEATEPGPHLRRWQHCSRDDLGLHAVGIILLGVAAMRAGVQSWAAWAMIAGAIVDLAGFIAGQHHVAAAGFAVMTLGFRRCGARIAGSGAGDEGAAQPCAM